MNKHKLLYEPVSVEDRLPEEGYHALLNSGEYLDIGYFDMEKWKSIDRDIDGARKVFSNVTHWLEPLTDRHVFTQDELLNLMASYGSYLYDNGKYAKKDAYDFRALAENWLKWVEKI